MPFVSVQFTRGSLLLLTLIVIGCTTLRSSFWNERFGEPTPRENIPRPAASGTDYHGDVQDIFERRCIVCHACYDAPCQLKLESFTGLLRGASNEKVYDGTRLLGANLTRLFEDADTTAEWRDKGFFPVLNERENTAEANLSAGVMARLLMLKQQHPLPRAALLPDSFDFDINRTMQCTKIETIASYEKNYPLWGMPYGLPALPDEEYTTLIHWLADGAPAASHPHANSAVQPVIAQWETFFNGDSLKQQLVNRYLYEHLFIAHLSFPEAPDSYFRLVRSSTPPGQPIARISTRRPFDDPGVKRVYYRLWQNPSTIVAKNFLPYRLDESRLKKWQQWFYKTDYMVSKLPSYNPETAANPFATFLELPVGSRYRFLLDEAQFTIMNFIKGPVCRGQIALNVIQDHFWVFFIDPEQQSSAMDARFLAENSKNLQLPASLGNSLLPLTSWHKYSTLQKDYLAAKARYIDKRVNEEGAVNIAMIWDGDGTNSNAALTVFRHSDSASVSKGLIGQDPKTAWVIGYPLLERIHYLLVAGFDVYGNVSHQLLSRLYMDFLRMEGEVTFLGFLPPETRKAELDFWYRNAEDEVHEYLDTFLARLNIKSDIVFSTDDPKTEFYGMLKQHLQPVLDHTHDLSHNNSIDTAELSAGQRKALHQLGEMTGPALRFLPQVTFIRVPQVGVFSLLHNDAYSNLSSLFKEDERHLPAEDSVTLAGGILGAYPNAFMLVDKEQLPDFAQKIAHLTSEKDYRHLRDRYGIRRSDPDFWQFSDGLIDYYRATRPREAGVLDYNRLENR